MLWRRSWTRRGIERHTAMIIVASRGSPHRHNILTRTRIGRRTTVHSRAPFGLSIRQETQPRSFMKGCYRITRVTDPLNHSTTYVWEDGSDPRIKAVIDPNEHRTTLLYTTLANRTRALRAIERPVIGRISFTYDAKSHCVSITDYDGHRTTLVRDANSQRIAVIDASNQRFTTLYNGNGQVNRTIDPLGNRTTTTYSAAGNAIAVADELRKRTTFTYNLAGVVTRVTDPLNQSTTYARDAVNRIKAITNPLNNGTTYAYDFNGSIRRASDPLEALRRHLIPMTAIIGWRPRRTRSEIPQRTPMIRGATADSRPRSAERGDDVRLRRRQPGGGGDQSDWQSHDDRL